jgi:allantoin racemase
MAKVLALLPILTNPHIIKATYEELKPSLANGLTVDVECIEEGPASIESEFDDRLASPWVLERVKQAELRGYDAVFLHCMGDIALHAARELVRIPVIGPCQTSMAVASMLGERFSIITVLQNVVPMFWRKAKEYGFTAQLASVRYVNVPVLELETRRNEVEASLVREAKRAVEEDGADVIILGCTGMVGMAKAIESALSVPVIDPVPVSIQVAGMLASLKLTHSSRSYPTPPTKYRRFPKLSEILLGKHIELSHG